MASEPPTAAPEPTGTSGATGPGTPMGAMGVLESLLDLRPLRPGEDTPIGTGTGTDAGTITGAGDPTGRTLGLVGPTEHPRFLLPLDHRAATEAGLLRYNRLRPLKTRVSRAGLAVAHRAGLRRPVTGTQFRADAGPGSLIAHLAQVLGEPDLQVAVGVGNFDAVWKPTLQCFDPTGTPLAFAKVGFGPVGAALVDNEREALGAVARAEDPRLVVPGLLAATTWRGHPIVAIEPMPADVARLPPGPVGAWPVRQLEPALPPGPLHAAPWWTVRAQTHGDHPQIGALLEEVQRVHDGPDRAWARAHGDWVPWNMARSSRGLVVWDWEYSEPGAPEGIDEVHGAYQQARVGQGRPVADALASARAAAPDEWVADAHLVMLATRYAQLHTLAGRPIADLAEVSDAAARRARELSRTPR